MTLFSAAILSRIIGHEVETEHVPFDGLTAYSGKTGFGNHTLRILNNLSPGDIRRLYSLIGALASSNGMDIKGLWIDDDADITTVRKFIYNPSFKLVEYDFIRWNEMERRKWGYQYNGENIATLNLRLSEKGKEIRRLAFLAFSPNPEDGASAREKMLSYKSHLSDQEWSD